MKSLFARMIVAFCMLSATAHAETISFSRVSMSNGLSNNQISCIQKDSRGFMWIGTASGLNRYDGYSFKVYKHSSSDSLSIGSNVIREVSEAHDGKLWVRTQAGYSVFNPLTESFSQNADKEIARYGVRGRVERVFFDCQKNVWFLLSTGTLHKWDYQTKVLRCFFRRSSMRNAAQVVDLKSRDGKVWILYSNGQVDCFSASSNRRISTNRQLVSSYTTSKSSQLFVDSSHDLWIYSYSLSEGMRHYSTKQRLWEQINSQAGRYRLSSNLILGVEEDAEGQIWVATDHGGVCIVNKKTGVISYLKNDPLNDRSLSQNSATCIYRDNLGIIWIGTYKQGISFYHESVFKFKTTVFPLANPDDYLKNDSNCFYEDPEGNLWVGTNGGGLLVYDRGGALKKVFRYTDGGSSSISSNIVVSLAADASGKLWIGTYMGGLDCFDGRSFKHYKRDPNNPSSISSNSIYSLYVDGQKNLWVGTLEGTLDRYNKESDSFSHFDIGANFCSKIIEDKAGNLLVSNPNGIARVNMKTGVTSRDFWHEGSKSFSLGILVSDILIDRRGLLWIATNEGVKVFNYSLGRFEPLGVKSDVLYETVVTIEEDRQGNVWLGTHRGLYMVAVKPNMAGGYRYSVKAFDKSDGLQGDEFNVNSSYVKASGEVIFGGPNGFNVFNPSRIIYSKMVPKIAFSDFTVLNSSVSKGDSVKTRIGFANLDGVTQTIRLKYKERNFSLQFVALSYFLPQKNRYRYFMEGFDKQWTEVNASSRKVTYTNLNPGKYVFMVEGSNNDGVWNPKPARIEIIVEPPFWATSFAYTIYFLLAIWAIYSIVMFFIRRQEKLFMEKQERFETQKLLDLDEMKLQFFTNISHELRTPLTLIVSPLERLVKKLSNDEDRKVVAIAHGNALKLLGMVNQLLDFRKIDANAHALKRSVGDVVSLVKEITSSFDELAFKKQLKLSFSSSIQSYYAEFDSDKLYKAIANIVSNAFKYTPDGGTVAVSVATFDDAGEERVVVEVADTGKGISVEDQQHIFDRFYRVETGDSTTTGTGIGLNIAYEFVKMHDGSIAVTSELGKGSTFSITLPLKRQAFVPDQFESEANDEEATELAFEDIQVQELHNAPTLLVVDDNEEFLDFMVSVLKESYNVLTATNGKEAWDTMVEQVPDMVISDVMMPEMDGFELCRVMQGDIRTSHIPIILLTARLGDDSKLEGLEAGANDYISKPFNMDVLLLKIKRLIELRRSVQQRFQQKKEIKSSEISISSLDDQLLKRAAEYVEGHMENPELSVEELSSHLAMSRVHLYKKLVSITGKTPIEFIRILRLKRAAQYFEKSQLSISEVAYKVGFNDPKYFRRYFKDEFGILPSEYKLRHEKPSDNS
jgi:signal transduction histidine kinase/ligand-binding sensor domain-containing protein/DNA-binding response OmpR family regulator